MKELIKQKFPNLKGEDYSVDFNSLSIDSMDLVSLRVEVENKLGRMIPNKNWLSFKNINDIISYVSIENKTSDVSRSYDIQTSPTLKKDKKNFITMPQMCLEALSENWLFKESGDVHWDMLCKGLGTSSSNLSDEIGNRLYATFVRIRMSSKSNLSSFEENNPYLFDSSISRYGLGMFFSKTNFESLSNTFKIEMMTSFAIRKSKGDNKTLTKSQPNVDNCSISQEEELPPFGNEYRLVKKGDLTTIFYQNFIFNITDKCLFEYEYSLNPYYDLNGVGLLYFASYPIISDYCELNYHRSIGRKNTEEEYFTCFRDIMYYANCDSNDVIIFRLNNIEELSENRIKTQATLYRKSDGKMMARVFTIKQKRIV